MKKLLLIGLIALCAFRVNEEKKYKVELTLDQWNAVLSIIDQSNAPHPQVVGAITALRGQLQTQIKPDTTKKK